MCLDLVPRTLYRQQPMSLIPKVALAIDDRLKNINDIKSKLGILVCASCRRGKP